MHATFVLGLFSVGANFVVCSDPRKMNRDDVRVNKSVLVPVLHLCGHANPSVCTLQAAITKYYSKCGLHKEHAR